MKAQQLNAKTLVPAVLAVFSMMMTGCGNGGGDGKSSSSNVGVQCGGPTVVNWDTGNPTLNAQNVTPQNFPAAGLRVSFTGTTPNGATCTSMPQFVGSFQMFYQLLSNDSIDQGSMCNTQAQRSNLRVQKNCSQANGGPLDPNQRAALNNGFIYCQSELTTETDVRWLFGPAFARRVNATVIPLNDRGARSFSVGSYQVTSKVISSASNRDNVQVEMKVKRANELVGTFVTGLDQMGSISIDDEETGRKLVVGCQYPNGQSPANTLQDELNIRCNGTLKRHRDARAETFSKDLVVDSTAEGNETVFSGGDEEIIVSYQTLQGFRKGGIIIEANGIGHDRKRDFKGGGTASSKQEMTFKEPETGYELSVKCENVRGSRVATDDAQRSERNDRSSVR